MACNEPFPVTCTECLEQFMIRIEAETVRQFRNQMDHYVCRGCRTQREN